MRFIFENEPDTANQIYRALVTRNFNEELPAETATFTYRRNLHECQRLKKSILRLEGKRLDFNDATTLNALEDASRLLHFELKKANWLEKEFYPVVFGKAINTARAEVNQFLIKQANTKGLERFRNAHAPKITLRDDLNYLLKGNPPESAGVYQEGYIVMRIPEHFTDRDEWRVYLIAVHELLHSVSHQDWGGVGLDKRSIDPDLEALNEAVTQLLTYRIALTHLDQERTHLRGQRQQRLSLTTMPYSEYTLIVRQIFSKIPMEYFTNAMLNQSGWNALRLKFKEEFGSEDAVIAYARNLRAAYLPPQQRKKGANIIPILRPHTTLQEPPPYEGPGVPNNTSHFITLYHAFRISPATGTAYADPSPPSSSRTVTTTCGSFAGA